MDEKFTCEDVVLMAIETDKKTRVSPAAIRQACKDFGFRALAVNSAIDTLVKTNRIKLDSTGIYLRYRLV